ncbi:MAG: hypothetical protein ACLRZ9_05585 [Eubacterium sp.]
MNTGRDYGPLEKLKNNREGVTMDNNEKWYEEQIKMCFDAYYSAQWTTLLD